ncbi:MAG: hypothetical protein ABIP29_10915, partial [Candidatus Eisenbacteria bacterium]
MTDPRNSSPTASPRHATRARNGLLVLIVVSLLVFAVLVRMEVFERFADWSRTHEAWQLDEVLMAAALLAFA